MPTIQSDLPDYAPGDTVTLTGSNWQPGELVHINVNDDVSQTWSRDVDVTADANGNITDQFQLPSTFVALYTVTATGPSSGTATTTFTDGNVNFKKGTQGPAPSYSFDWKLYSNTTCAGTSPIQSGSLSVVNNNEKLPVDPNQNQSVKLSNVQDIDANTNPNFTFHHWSINQDGSSALGGTGDCVAGDNSAQNIYAQFRNPSAVDTSIDGTSQPTNPSNDSTPAFDFSSNHTGSTVSFECKLDAQPFAACTSPKTYPTTADGSHTFQVRAIDDGNVDPTPASYTWTIDTLAPKVDTVSPTENATNVPVGNNVTAHFLEANNMDASTINANNFTLKQGSNTVSATVTYDPNSKTATLDPNPSTNGGNLAPSTQYTATVASPGVKDLAQNALDQDGTAGNQNSKSWIFTTAAACTTPNAPVFATKSTDANGSNGWFRTIPTVSASTSTAGATITYATEVNGGTKSAYSATAPTLGQGTTKVYAKATSGTCTSETSDTFKVDSIAPGISPGDVTNTTWRNTPLGPLSFTASDGGSGLAPSQNLDANNSFTLTASAESVDADTPTVVSKTVSDVAGNSTTRSVSAKIDLHGPAANCDSAPTSWSKIDVSIHCQPTDALSGLASAGDANFDLSTNVAANTQTSNASTNSRTVADAAGNSVTAGPITGLKVDKKAPEFNCGTADGNWHGSDVSISCTAGDGDGSGLANAADTSFNLSTNVDAGNENSDASTESRNVADAVGNSATAGPVLHNKVDRKAPVLTDDGPTPTDPNGANGWYTSAVTNDFTATDGGSGFAPNGDLTKSISQSSGPNEGGAVKIASGDVEDAVGNKASSINSAEFQIDLTPPTITGTLDKSPASTGWYNSNTGAPTVSFNCSDKTPGSGLAANACPSNYTFGNGDNQSHEGTVTDIAGRSASTHNVNGIKVDLDAPSAPNATTNPANPVANSGGFFKDTVNVSYSGSNDVGPSGVASYTATQTFNTSGTNTYSGTATDTAGNVSNATTGQVKVDKDAPTFSSCPSAGPFLVNSGLKSVGPISASDGSESGVDAATSTLSGSVDTSSTGTKSVSFTAKDKVGHSATKQCTYNVNTYTFVGFSSPVDNPSVATNSAKAGQASPLKWRLMDGTTPVTNLQNVTVTVKDYSCGLTGSLDLLEEYAAGSSGLQNLGNGYYQYNWKSPTNYASSCKVLQINGEGMQLTATQQPLFKFTK